MVFMDFTQQIEDKVEDFEKLLAERTEKAKVFGTKLHQALDELFSSDPNLVAITWTQFTPMWNDGDACTFSVYPTELVYPATFEPQPSDKYYEMDEIEVEGVNCNTYEPSYTLDTSKQLAVDRILQADEELCEFVFGECALVVITRDKKVIVEETEAPY